MIDDQYSIALQKIIENFTHYLSVNDGYGDVIYGGFDRLYLLSNLMIPSIRRNKNNSIEKIEEDIRKELYKYKNSVVGKMDDDLLEEMIHKLGENIESFLEIPEERDGVSCLNLTMHYI